MRILILNIYLISVDSDYISRVGVDSSIFWFGDVQHALWVSGRLRRLNIFRTVRKTTDERGVTSRDVAIELALGHQFGSDAWLHQFHFTYEGTSRRSTTFEPLFDDLLDSRIDTELAELRFEEHRSRELPFDIVHIGVMSRAKVLRR